MRKKFAIFLCLLTLAGCSDNKPMNNLSESSEVVAETEKDAGFDYEQMRLNIELNCDNPSINLKSPVPAKICGVSATDTLFYSDSNGLFQKNGEDIIMLSKSEAMAITLYRGYLYYIVLEKTDSFPSGKVYCMNLETGEERCIIEQDDISNLFVANDTLYYTVQIKKNLEDGSIAVGRKRMKCGLNGENPADDVRCLVSSDGNYNVAYMSDTISVFSSDNTEILFAVDNVNAADEICIYNDKVYYIEYDYNKLEQNSIGVIDCNNSTNEKILAKTSGGNFAYFVDYGFADGSVYMYDSVRFYKETADGMLQYEADNSYKSIYSAESSLYALKHDGSIARLSFTDENTVEEEVLNYENSR